MVQSYYGQQTIKDQEYTVRRLDLSCLQIGFVWLLLVYISVNHQRGQLFQKDCVSHESELR